MALYVGSSPVPVVPMVISTMVITSTRLRPDPITEWAEDQPAEGSHHERRCQSAERGDQMD